MVTVEQDDRRNDVLWELWETRSVFQGPVDGRVVSAVQATVGKPKAFPRARQGRQLPQYPCPL